VDLARRAGQQRGWQPVECVQYGERVTKTAKTFLATWRPAGGVIRVVLVQEERGWVPSFCTDPEASVVDILEAAADRGAIEQTNKDVKEVWGAGQQQLRNLYANVGAFNLDAWLHTAVETWAWERSEEELVDRSQSPWDGEPRRSSHPAAGDLAGHEPSLPNLAPHGRVVALDYPGQRAQVVELVRLDLVKCQQLRHTIAPSPCTAPPSPWFRTQGGGCQVRPTAWPSLLCLSRPAPEGPAECGRGPPDPFG
jgi:hypothetical protein